jgi:photosystem II stability/assembly factor-like uncharacterized protein
MTLYVAFDEALAIVNRRNGGWVADLQLIGKQPQCVAVDPLRPELIYCGTFDQGLWRSSDAGRSWQHVDEGITHNRVMSVAVSAMEHTGGHGVVYAGTEPSALFRSEDSGKTWKECAALRQLPSASTWSFPPRPYTSHIRWITPHPVQPGHIFVAAEAGALVRSKDGGQTWEDRKPGGPFDTHTLVIHKLQPDRLHSAAGDGFLQAGTGFAQSDDGGDTWYRPGEGLEHHYLWSMAADPADPSTLVVSAAHSPRHAHNQQQAESVIYRRSGNSPWQQVREGLPEPRGLLACVLTTNEAEPGVFYASGNRDVYRSTNAGLSWEILPVHWPAGTHAVRTHALAIVEA